MPQLERFALLPYRAADLYRLVADIEAYPEFLPGCVSAAIEASAPDRLRARLGFRLRGIRDSFATDNELDGGTRIAMRLVEGPFRALAGAWEFRPLGESACRVQLSLQLEFGSRVLEGTLGPFLDPAVSRVMEAFRLRAGALHARAAGGAGA